MTSTPSIWTKDICKATLKRERLDIQKSRQEFWHKLTAWHLRRYEVAGNPPVLEWADKCLEVMSEVEKEMGLDNPPLGAEFASHAFQGRVIEPTEGMHMPPITAEFIEDNQYPAAKKSLFGGIKKKSLFGGITRNS